MPFKKKLSGNGFFHFMMKIKNENTNLENMQEVQDFADHLWKNMSVEEKRPFKEKAIKGKYNFNYQNFQNYFSNENQQVDGSSLDNNEQNKIQQMRSTIKNHIETVQANGGLDVEVFFLIHLNKLIYHSGSNSYLVCEIAISHFSLKNGVYQDVFHRIIKPGKLPLGFKSEAKIESENTHNLYNLLYGDDDCKNNENDVFNDMIDYINKYYNGNKPILYALNKNNEIIKNVFERWSTDFGIFKEIKIYNIEYLFYKLRNAVANKIIWNSDAFSLNEIEKDIFAYSIGTGCEYHEVCDLNVYCSKSIVIRNVYLICKFCCDDLHIVLKPGFHIPIDLKVNTSTNVEYI